MKLHLTIEMPAELLKEWLQLVRDFDILHGPGVHFTIGAEGAGLSPEEAEEIFAGVRPPFKHMMRVRKPH